MRSLLWLVSLPFRLVGSLLVLAGFGVGFWDLYLSVDSGQMALTPLRDTVASVSPDLLGLPTRLDPESDPGTGVVVEPAIAPAVEFFLNLPSFLALLILATLFLLVAQLIYRPR